MQIIFLGTAAQGLHGNGKQFAFIETAAPILRDFGHSVHGFSDAVHLLGCDRTDPTLVCMIYNEEGTIDERVEIVEAFAKRHFADLRILNGVAQGRVIGDKIATTTALSKHGVPTPQLITSSRSIFPVLSRAVSGSGLPVKLVAAGDDLDRDRINTVFVDTRAVYKAKEYYVSLRSMCFWRQHISTYVRCRAVSDGGLSVHSADTPPDKDLINYLYSALVMPRMAEIEALCRQAGEALGPGFFAHDLLPTTDGGPILLCETGFKYDEMYIGTVLRELAGQLLMSEIFDNAESRRMAYAFAQAIDRIPRWNEAQKGRYGGGDAR